MVAAEESDDAPLIENEKSEIVEDMGSSTQLCQNEPETYWPSIYIVSALSFTGSSQFSIYLSSLWPYLQIVSFYFICIHCLFY